jgi:hypothetical protein
MSKKQVAKNDFVFEGSGDGSNQSPDVRKAVKLLNNYRMFSFLKDSVNMAIYFRVL